MRAILVGPCLQSRSSGRALVKKVRPKKDDLWIGVDGGVGVLASLGRRPDFGVGDWDSLDQKGRKILSRIPHITLRQDKDRSDLFYAVLSSLRAGATEILCIGVSGYRPDHHFSMLADLSYFSSGAKGPLKAVEVWGDEADYSFLSEKIPSCQLSLKKGSLISIFAMTNTVSGVCTSGFQYSLQNALLKPSSQGLSNVNLKSKCEVRLRKGRLLIIIPKL